MRKEYINIAPPVRGLYLTRCGYEVCTEPCRHGFEENGGYMIFGVAGGAGTVEANGSIRAAYKGDAMIFRPGTKIICSCEDKNRLWTVFWIGFGGEDAEYYVSELAPDGSGELRRSDAGGALSAMEKFFDTFAEKTEAGCQSEVNSFLLEAISSLKPKRTPRVRMRASEQAERALKYIENNYMNGITARDVSAELKIDRTHFFRVFKSKTGISPEKYIMALRIKKSKELLETSSCTVTEISSLVGVNDVYYFSKLFKKAEGVSPTEYRKLHGGSNDD